MSIYFLHAFSWITRIFVEIKNIKLRNYKLHLCEKVLVFGIYSLSNLEPDYHFSHCLKIKYVNGPSTLSP